MDAKIPNPTDKHVGQRVRMRRLMLGVTQEKLGDAIGITFQQVQKYEKGTNRISSSRLQQIASVLQVAPTFFFEGGPTSQSKTVSHAPMPDYASEMLATKDGLGLVRAFTQIRSATLRRAIVHLVEELGVEPR
jgi:transcriptional regulator with XRE-family HTH domain